MSRPSQADSILQYLAQGNTITPLEALAMFGTLRLSERCREIEALGVPIIHTPVQVGKKRVMSYKLAIPHG